MRGVCLALVLAAVVSIATGSAAAANYAQENLDRYSPVVPAASYRVQVLFFDWGKGGGS